MRTFTGLVAGVLLAGLSLACSLSARAVEAKSDKPATAQAMNKVAMKATSTPLHPAWRIGAVISFNNMMIFPVVSNEPASTAEFITLDEGLRSGKVIITDNTLVSLDVFCVEHGRWSGETSFGQSQSVAGSPGIGAGGIDGSEAREPAAPPAAIIAMPNVRAKAQAEKSQTEVWAKVKEAQTENVVVTASGALNSVYQDKRVASKLDSYQRAFKDKLSASNVVGVVVAVSGRIISADVFASHPLFQAYWPKMLKSYALEALNPTGTSNQEIDRSDAESYLARVQGEGATNGEPSIYRLAENQSSKDASFELESTTKKPVLVHFNRVSKQ